jgi:chorismate--pyruvate lyase
VSFHSVASARWYGHVNGVNAPREMRGWLADTASLTVKLTAHSRQFKVQRLRQQYGICLADEFAIVDLPRRGLVQEREVLLRCDGEPMVYAHTIVPLDATASDWPFFSTLGERSLGTTLFGDPRVVRGKLQYARLRAQHPLVRRASTALGGQDFVSPLFARRCLYRRKSGVLLVTEMFLPAITELNARRHDGHTDKRKNQ